MKKRLASFLVMVVIIFPSISFAYTREKGTTPKSSTEDVQTKVPAKNKSSEAEDIFEKQMKSANALVVAGYVVSAAGGLTAIAGSIYVVAKKNSRTTGAIIAGSGAALALTGGILTIMGMHKRSLAESGPYSLAPIADPQTSTYGLAFAMNF